ncbi:hypothetical protein SASPL_148683 [Salvia splendens]|uniref:Uncharacterized protein n=1 Tax=Salvia splendens TaxID=180675 RepID=A0A8X8W9S7_SALSN|nr:hypothetical protein SASPL_148683 [Salvia splendens]
MTSFSYGAALIPDWILFASNLWHDKVEYVLDKPIGVIPDKESLEFATFDVEAHQKHIDNASDAQCAMLSSMTQTMEYEILRDLFKCKFHDGGKVSEHVLKMISLIESFENFIVNFNMNNMKVGLPELHNRLKTYESSTAKVKFVLMVSSSAKSSKWKNKQQQKKKASKDDT